MKGERLRGERIQLVPLEQETHLEHFVRWFHDLQVTRYLSRRLPLIRLQEASWFEWMDQSEHDIAWAILEESGKHIGVTGIHRIDWTVRSGITSLIIGEKSCWGQGYGTDAMRTRVRYAFEQLKLQRLESECSERNVGSIRCLEKAGYRRIGIIPKDRWHDGRWHDSIRWEILAESYLQRQR
jgi:ribosomal-protein-alanine N-acetyltransferase